jgi:DNA polymerase-3 subunit delta'
MADVFDGVIGHQPVVALLRREIGAPAQSYLFVGPSNTGKATVARRFAAGLLCDGDPGCLRRVLAGNHPDLVLVEPDGRSAITVDQARHTVSQASLAPLVGDRKVFLFEEGGVMNDEAANALLKTLEEPSASTVFIIVAESEDDLPETVASRCRTVIFGRVADEEVAEGLAAHGIPTEQATQAARISGGRPGLALSLATQSEVAAFRHAWLSVPLRVTTQPGDAYLLADEVGAACEPLLAALKEQQAADLAAADAEGASTKALKERQERELKRATAALYVSGLEILAGFYRDAAAAQYGAKVRNPDIPATALTGVLPATAVANAERVLATIEALESNQRPTLAFANLFADLGAGG